MRAAPPNDPPSPTIGSKGFEDSDEPLIPPGNALRPRSLLWVVLPALLLLSLMAKNRHFDFAVPIGVVLVVISSIGLLDTLGTFDDPNPPNRLVSARSLGPEVLKVCFALVGFVVAVRLAVAGVLPKPMPSAAVLVTASAWLLLFTGRQFCQALRGAERGLAGKPRAFAKHEGFWLMSLGLILYLPLLGSFSLIDPWETHYGEVAREMLARDDWISLWWAQEGFFWSKPVLSFWLQGLSFSLFGVRWEPDQMLSAFADGRMPAPEWALRLPGLGLTLLATYLGYKAVARSFGRRAGFLSGVVLLTVPYWLFLSHQSMTDMPYVAALTAALALISIGLGIDPERRVKTFEVTLHRRGFRVSAAHAVLGLVVATAAPQIVYLISRNLKLSLGSPWFEFQMDRFMSGSGGGNCGLPGNSACESFGPMNQVFQPALTALIWAIALTAFLVQNRGERRVQRLCFLAAWYFTALSLLAKGAPGLVLALVTTLLSIASAKRFRDFARIELVSLVLIVACVALPWYVQAFMRHGPAFTDRLLFYDMYKRAFVHVHDTNAGEDVSFRYYIWQLGYGLFPWTGFAVAGLLSWLSWGDEAERRRAEVGTFLGLWFLMSFAMFSVSLTKFHHYVLPAVPPVALLTGIALDRMLGRTRVASYRRRMLAWTGWLFTSVFALCGALAISKGRVLDRLGGSSAGAEPTPLLGGLFLLASCVAFAAGNRAIGESSRLRGPAPNAFAIALQSLFCALGAGITGLVGRDLFSSGATEGQARLLNLFSYNYARAWPNTVDFRPALFAFTCVFVLLSLLSLIPRLRGPLVRVFLCTALLFCGFLLNSYLVRLAPHWGQRDTILAYYATRSGPEEPLVAYQMNWKGENFYTGNRLTAFISSGDPFKLWIREQRQAGVRVLYFTSEHNRVSSLRSELGHVKAFQLLTQKQLNNKFFLARVEL